MDRRLARAPAVITAHTAEGAVRSSERTASSAVLQGQASAAAGIGADVAGGCTDAERFDQGAAGRAGLAGAVAHLQVLRIVAGLAPGILFARAAAPAYALLQHVLHGPVQALHLFGAEGTRGGEGMQASVPEDILDVDVADAGQSVLIEQVLFQRAAPCSGHLLVALPGAPRPAIGDSGRKRRNIRCRPAALLPDGSGT